MKPISTVYHAVQTQHGCRGSDLLLIPLEVLGGDIIGSYIQFGKGISGCAGGISMGGG